jgi:phage tail-like protein
MDANQTRFHLLLGETDWATCAVPDESGAIFSRDSAVAWNDFEVTLQPELFRFQPAPRDDPPSQNDRRGAAADVNLNWYWIGKKRDEIRVHSRAEPSSARFWPAAETKITAQAEPEVFQPMASPDPACACEFSGLAVTEDQYLIVGTLEPKGLLVFDLLGGGPPRAICWPAQIAFAPFDIVPRHGGGVWILDREHKRFWGLDRTLRVLTRDQHEELLGDAEDEIFQPASGRHHGGGPRTFPDGIDLAHGSPVNAIDPVAIEVLPDDTVLILDAGSGGSSRVLRCRFGEALGDMPLHFTAYDFAFAGETLAIVSAEGNQAFAYPLADLLAGHQLTPLILYFPLRRFGGKALVSACDQVYYDFAERWLPLQVQRHSHYLEDATIVTRVFEGREPQCVWHRLLLDACLPAGADVEVSSRVADDETLIDQMEWNAEPPLHQRDDGSELPFLPKPLALQRGTFELLLQKARGRFLQLRLHLIGDGRVTPHLTAARIYYPRFSYRDRYLPAVYREDAASASFLDRFLANLEGTNTAIEDRIAAAQVLFDVRSTPADALAWLASWFGVVLDPSWDENRQRLFIAHAMEFFQWRGTVRGIQMALRLALDEHVDEHIFDPPGAACRCGDRYRIVEKFLSRGRPAVEVGDPTEIEEGFALAPVAGKWKPQHGATPLHARYRAATGRDSFSLTPIADDPAAEAARIVFAKQELGFVPSDPSEEIAAWRVAIENGNALPPQDEPSAPEIGRAWRAFQISSDSEPYGQQRRLWQQSLVRRYVSLVALNSAHGTQWKDFGEVAYPINVPANASRLADWMQFETQVLPTLAAAHRFTVLLPITRVSEANDDSRHRTLALASRIVDLEKPAHTAFDVKFFWAHFRIGEARLGADTVLGPGGRDPALLPRQTILGQSYLSESLIASDPPPSSAGRTVLGRDRLKHNPPQNHE